MSRRVAVSNSHASVRPGAPSAPALLGVSLKMYLDVSKTRAWAREVSEVAGSHPAIQDGKVQLFVLPSFTSIEASRRELEGSAVAWGAQDLHWEDRGAFTGAVSGSDLAELGCGFVEVGHAERKSIFQESSEVVGRKLEAAFRNGLTPVLCVGEPDEVSVFEASQACIAQLEDAFSYVSSAGELSELVVAYEPEWAIGQAEPASSGHVREVSMLLREWLDVRFAGQRASIIYGGSAQKGTLSQLGGAVDGLFLGRFAHDVRDLAAIIDEAAAAR